MCIQKVNTFLFTLKSPISYYQFACTLYPLSCVSTTKIFTKTSSLEALVTIGMFFTSN